MLEYMHLAWCYMSIYGPCRLIRSFVLFGRSVKNLWDTALSSQLSRTSLATLTQAHMLPRCTRGSALARFLNLLSWELISGGVT